MIAVKAAEELDVKRSTFYNLVKNGKIFMIKKNY